MYHSFKRIEKLHLSRREVAVDGYSEQRVIHYNRNRLLQKICNFSNQLENKMLLQDS